VLDVAEKRGECSPCRNKPSGFRVNQGRKTAVLNKRIPACFVAPARLERPRGHLHLTSELMTSVTDLLLCHKCYVRCTKDILGGAPSVVRSTCETGLFLRLTPRLRPPAFPKLTKLNVRVADGSDLRPAGVIAGRLFPSLR